MSAFMVLSQSIQFRMMQFVDTRGVATHDRWYTEQTDEYRSAWPSSRLSGSDATAYILGQDSQSATGYWEWQVRWQGARTRKVFSGFTYKGDGTILPGCNVEGFVTATDTTIGSVVSAPDGSFTLPTPYAVQHYLVSYRAGSPDMEGTTSNSLLPT